MTLFVQLSKVWNIVSNLATAHSFMDSPIVDILNEIGGGSCGSRSRRSKRC